MSEKTKNIYDKLNPPVEEAFRVLRTNIYFCNLEKKVKSIAIVSCNPKEGKTSVAINLAISIARTGSKVLLVDADLRKPMLIKRLSEMDFYGLSSILLGKTPIDEAICNTSIDNLDYISCGLKPPNPSELIGAEKFKEFLKTVEELYDMVIIDTSSMESVIDGAIIASHTHGTLIVIENRSVRHKKVKRLKEQLNSANANILGVVLNKVNKRDYKDYNNNYNNLIYFKKPKEESKISKKKSSKIELEV